MLDNLSDGVSIYSKACSEVDTTPNEGIIGDTLPVAGNAEAYQDLWKIDKKQNRDGELIGQHAYDIWFSGLNIIQ
jgi:hypothetical protein